MPVWMTPTAGDFRTLHHGEVLLAVAPGLSFPIAQPDTPNVRALSALSPMWSYITLAGASHASPQPSGHKNEERAGQDDLGREDRWEAKDTWSLPFLISLYTCPGAVGWWAWFSFPGTQFPHKQWGIFSPNLSKMC